VIGSGIAGLSCATALQQAGLEVSLVDKSRGPGGRMSTRQGDDWQGDDWQCDHGAQYFTARHAEFRAAVARWQQAGVADLWAPRLWRFDGDSRECRESRVERFVGTPTMTAPARYLASTLSVQAPANIQQIRRQAHGWQVCPAEHGWLETSFSAVLLAVPAPQVAPLLKQLEPGLVALADRAVMRGSWALMLRFAALVNLAFNAAFVNQGPLLRKSNLVMSGSGELEMSAVMGSGGFGGGTDRDERERGQATGSAAAGGGRGHEPACGGAGVGVIGAASPAAAAAV